MKTRPPKMVTLRPGGRIVPQWYWLTAFELFGAGVVLLIVGLVRMHGVGEIVLGVALMFLCPLALYFGGPFGDRPYGR